MLKIIHIEILMTNNVYYVSNATTLEVLYYLIIATHENFKHTYECLPTRMRLGLRISPLIGDIQVCILPYVLQLCPSISLHVHIRVLRITH